MSKFLPTSGFEWIDQQLAIAQKDVFFSMNMIYAIKKSKILRKKITYNVTLMINAQQGIKRKIYI